MIAEWGHLTLEGRVGVRKHYRSLRELGQSRIMARTLTAEVLHGVAMGRYGWGREWK